MPHNNQTQRDEELRGKISDFMADLMVEVSLQKISEETDLLAGGRKFISAHNTRLNAIMRLIKVKQEEAVQDAQNELIGFVHRELGERDVADAMKRYQLTPTQPNKKKAR